jgi:hypothetical protein
MSNDESMTNAQMTKVFRPSVAPWHLAAGHSGFGHSLVMRISSFVILVRGGRPT